MSDQPTICPQCQADTTQALRGGFVYCPACGAGFPQPATPSLKPPVPLQGAPRLFWILLLSPSVLALLTFLLGQISETLAGIAFVLGLGASLFSLFASIYCGRWLANRFWPEGGKNALATVGLSLLIIAVNGIIVFVGCAANVRID